MMLKINGFISYHILSIIVCTFFKENDDEILAAHCSWKLVEKVLKDQVGNMVLMKISQLKHS
jgi:hypothetical protein